MGGIVGVSQLARYESVLTRTDATVGLVNCMLLAWSSSMKSGLLLVMAEL